MFVIHNETRLASMFFVVVTITSGRCRISLVQVQASLLSSCQVRWAMFGGCV